MATDSPQPCEHPQLADLLSLYAVHALDAGERAQVDAHVETCPTCELRLAREQATLAELAHLAPQTALPGGMRARVLGRALDRRAAVSGVDHSGQAGSEMGALMPSRPAPRQRLAPAAILPEAPNRIARLPKSQASWRSRLLLIAAVLVLALLPWNVVLQTQLAQQQATTRHMQQAQQTLAAILASPHLAVYALAGTRDAQATGHVYIDPDGGRVAVVASDLPQLDANHTYQAWLNHDGVRTSVGTFRPFESSNSVLIGSLPRSLSYYQSLGVTIEPAAGSPHPTGPNVMLGSF
jgi:anti-sigma-K factor RskA